MATIDKGIISSFESDTDRNGDLMKARVLPSTAQWSMRKKCAGSLRHSHRMRYPAR